MSTTFATMAEADAFMSRFKLTHVYPPIPIRDFDWQATLGDYDEGDPVGHGATPKQAIADLLEQLDEALS